MNREHQSIWTNGISNPDSDCKDSCEDSVEIAMIHDVWMRDDTGTIDLCLYCVHDKIHPLGAVCTGWTWNGKKFNEYYPGTEVTMENLKKLREER